MKLPKLEPTQEEKDEMRDRMNSLIDFFEMNDVPPADAVSMSMRFIACTCKGQIMEDRLVSMFRIIVRSVNRGEE